jgi:hypothetical protein
MQERNPSMTDQKLETAMGSGGEMRAMARRQPFEE